MLILLLSRLRIFLSIRHRLRFRQHWTRLDGWWRLDESPPRQTVMSTDRVLLLFQLSRVLERLLRIRNLDDGHDGWWFVLLSRRLERFLRVVHLAVVQNAKAERETRLAMTNCFSEANKHQQFVFGRSLVLATGTRTLRPTTGKSLRSFAS